mmetsp:Transcript_11324/g.17466  ORF Transcript_11324/g.17466 Transcript_11324/m.17466 type:complete len:231 (-) Transcript_11324:232-924(-)
MSEEAEANSSSSSLGEEDVKSPSLDKDDAKSSSLGPGIFVQPMKSEDASAIAEIWAEGVLQIAETVPFYFKGPVLQEAKKCRDGALMYDGDVGPQGVNLLEYWKEEGRVMFVAVFEDNPAKVVGCVGVQLGCKPDEIDTKSEIGSIWKLSVDQSVRRRGVGKALVEEAESWAKSRDCKSMRLVTANFTAATFYCEKMGYVKEPVDWTWNSIRPGHILGRPTPLWYCKSLT